MPANFKMEVLSPEEERSIIRDISEAAESNTKEGDTYYLLSFRWWKDWVDYICQGTANGNKDNMASLQRRPLAIDNSELVADIKGEDSGIESDLLGTLREGCDYILLPADVWNQLHKWYGGGPTLERKAITSGLSDKDLTIEVYPLRLHLVVYPKGSRATIRISKKETIKELYRRVCELFDLSSEHVSIWDYFAQRKHVLMNDMDKTLQDSQIQMDQDILVELKSDECINEENQVSAHENGFAVREPSFMPGETSKSCSMVAGDSYLRKGFSKSYSSELSQNHPPSSQSKELGNGYGMLSRMRSRMRSAGLTGLQNLGNTCYMNSAIQCLVHTPEFVRYFLEDYMHEINRDNPLGMVGEYASAFGELLRKLWTPGTAPVAPRQLKTKLGRQLQQFRGYNQHDSQELLAFLLDGLHEDLNRVKDKTYIESQDAEGRSDDEVADEYWDNHIASNNSIIVDTCQGQFKSTLVCPACNKVSVTFDPFMYLSLPLSSAATRTMTVTVFSSSGSMLPAPYTVTVPKQGRCKDLIQAVANACSLKDDERLILAEIFNNQISRFMEDPSESLTAIKDDDSIAAYRLRKCSERTAMLIISHRRREEYASSSQGKFYGTPLVANLSVGTCTGVDIQTIVQSLLSPMLKSKDLYSADQLKTARDSNTGSPNSRDIAQFNLQLLEESRGGSKVVPLSNDAQINIPKSNKVQVYIDWLEEELEKYKTHFLQYLPEVYKSNFSTKKTKQDSISLYTCLDHFLMEEPLVPDDMWFCPYCQRHRQASKKMDLWRLPEVLIVHLKRFYYSQSKKHKLETFVDFPIDDLELTRYVARKSASQKHRYELYAVSNHFGNMAGGHYTAHVKLIDENRWYTFDDTLVSPISLDEIRTSGAYVLFYRRVKAEGGSAENGIHSFSTQCNNWSENKRQKLL